MSISSDEINLLIYRYLQENGFSHSAFTFAYESLIAKTSVAQTEIPPGSLITFLQKGLEYISIEEHINEDGSIKDFESNYSLLSPLICEALALKEDRRSRKAKSHLKESLNDENSLAMDIAPNEEIKSASDPLCAKLIHKDPNNSNYLKIPGHKGEVFICNWNPKINQVASGSADGICKLWNLLDIDAEKWNSNESEIYIQSAFLPHSAHDGEKFKDVTSITWSPDGEFLATGCYDGLARIWDRNGTQIRLLKEHNGPVFTLKWSKNGDYILSGSYDHRVIVWNAKTGEIHKTYLLHESSVLDVDWKDDEIFATCSSDKTIKVCSLNPDSAISKTFVGHDDEVNTVCWSPGGELLASCSDDSTAKIWTIENELKHDLKGHTKEIFSTKWTPTGPGSPNPEKKLYLCTASFDGTVKVWNSDTGSILFDLSTHSKAVYSLSISPKADYLAAGSSGGNVFIWSFENGKLSNEVSGEGDTFDVSWNHDGSMLCSCFSSGDLIILDTSS